MSAFDRTKIPTDITTFEQLVVWAGLALHRVNPRSSVLEVPGNYAERTAQAVILNADEGRDRMIIRDSIELDPAYSSDFSHGLWYWAKPLSDTAIPATFLS